MIATPAIAMKMTPTGSAPPSMGTLSTAGVAVGRDAGVGDTMAGAGVGLSPGSKDGVGD